MIIRALAGALTGLVAAGTLAVGFVALAPAPGPGPQVAPAPQVQQSGTPGAAPRLQQPTTLVSPTPAVPGDAAPRRTLSGQPSEPTPEVSAAPAPVRAAPAPDSVAVPRLSSEPRGPVSETPVLPSPLASEPRPPEGERDVVLGAAPVAPAEVPVEPKTTPPPVPATQAPAQTPRADVPPVQIATPGSGVPEGEMAPAAPGVPDTGASPLAQGMLPIAPVVTSGAERIASGKSAVRINRPGDSALDETEGALARFRETVIVEPDLPMLSIVLMHDTVESIPSKILQDLPFPVSIALMPDAVESEDLMRRYRDMGHEVLAIADLPRGAAPEDMEIALEATFDLLPEAVGLLDAGAVALGSDRSVIASAVGRLKSDGRGLVTLSSGLNMAEREALRQQVPVAVVYRDMDGEGQAKRTIRRFLDQASFRARQQGSVVLLARLKTNTIEALDDWGRRSAERVVQIVPVSAVLRAQMADPAAAQ